MKTKILSIATILFAVLLISNKTFAAAKDDDGTTGTVLSDVTNISQIEVHGNVELYISSGDHDKVKVYNNYYSHNALVQQQNGVLRISSYTAEKLVVWVTVNDLRAVSAYDQAAVKSFGKFSGIEFSLNLNNNASASFDMDCYQAKIAVNDNARADISGTAAESYMLINHAATVNATHYTAAVNVQKRLQPAVTAMHIADELAFN